MARPDRVRFTEEMRGAVGFGAATHREGWDEGIAATCPLMFHLTISVTDLDRFAADPDHAAVAIGWVRCPALSDTDMPVERGWFDLFAPGQVAERTTMRYRLWFRDCAGQPLTLSGVKDVGDDAGLDIWEDTTSLFTNLLDGHVPAPERRPDGRFVPDDPAVIRARGILVIRTRDFARQLTTFRGTPRGVLRFAGMFTSASVADVPGPGPSDRRVVMDGDHTGAEGTITALHALRPLPFDPQRPVRWLDPRVLFQTGVQLVLSGLFERFADKRENFGGIVAPDIVAPGSDTDDVWVDYVSDVGDGFDATVTVAWMLAQDQLTVDDEGPLPRGSVLVFGGDEVYPFASLEEYENRTIGPYRAMLPHTDAPHPLILAIPGNHDWYDGLTAFMRVFAQVRPDPTPAPPPPTPGDGPPPPSPPAGRWIGGWLTAQRRSYFAVQLRPGWWLWGIDIQLDTYIDNAEMEYFNAQAQRLRPGDAVILCCARPSWLHCGPGDPESYSVLDFFERTFIRPTRANLRLTLTGDHHSYARYVGHDGEQKIIAGGGGAYLDWGHHFRPTLDLPPTESRDPGKTDQRPFRLVGSSLYPSVGESRAEAARFWRVLWRNGPYLPLMVAVMYGVWAALIPDPTDVWSVRFLGPCVVAVVMLMGLTHEHTAISRGVATLHAAAHLGAVLALSWLFRSFVAEPRTLLLAGAVGVAGAVVGPLLLGLYLRLADTIEINAGELFAAQRLETHKCFLRMRITPEGDLTIYPIGIREVFHRWTLLPHMPDGPPIAPVGADPTRWHLIEAPIVITRTPTTTGAP